MKQLLKIIIQNAYKICWIGFLFVANCWHKLKNKQAVEFFSYTFFICLLFSSNIQLTQAHSTDPNPYLDQLSIEADETSLKQDDAATIDKESPEPAVVPTDSDDINALSKKVGDHLEQILTGASSKSVKQKKIANLISDASKEGHKLNAIQEAVNIALKDLNNNKKNSSIQPASLDLAKQTISEIMQTNKAIVQDGLIDPYIEAINTEVEETIVNDKGQESSTSESVVFKNKKYQEIRLTQPTVQTVTVKKNDTLYKISKELYSSPYKSTLLFEANRDLLKNNPNLLEIGQVLKVPRLLHLP